jgi:addiction module HigA family antidote
MNKIEPIHAGEILLEEFIQPFGISQNALAKALKVTPRRINEIVNRKRAITADTALRLSKFFGNSIMSSIVKKKAILLNVLILTMNL